MGSLPSHIGLSTYKNLRQRRKTGLKIRVLTPNFRRMSELTYPGEPLIIASAILETFPSWEAAFDDTEGALASSAVPGTWESINAALEVLHNYAQYRDNYRAALLAHQLWGRLTGFGIEGDHAENYGHGMMNASAWEEIFVENLLNWSDYPLFFKNETFEKYSA